MALQASGQISASDINTELGRSASAEHYFASAASGTYGTINTSSVSRPNPAQPHAISEWYSYDHGAAFSSTHYWNTGDNRIDYDTGSGFPTSVTTGFSISLWVAPRWTSGSGNNVFLNVGNDRSTTSNRWFIQYHYSFNRLVFNRRANGSNHQQQWGIHDNSSATGISSSSTKFDANNGDKNADGFTHLVFTYDGTQTGSANTMKVYWNGTQLTSTAGFNDSNSIFAHPTMDELAINGNTHNLNGTRDTDYDMIQMYDTVLSSSDVTTLYNSGAPITAEDASLDTNLIFEDRAQSATSTDEAGNWTFDSNGGATVTAY